MGALNNEKSIKLNVGDKELQILIHEGGVDRPVLLLLHGATNDMNHPLIKGLAKLIAERGWSTVRFNFSFVEEGKRPDFTQTTKEYMSVLRWIRNSLGGNTVYVAGKSLGAFVSIFHARSVHVDGIVAFGYPIKKPDGSPIDQTHLRGVNIPILFIQGTADPYADKSLLEKVINEHRLNALSLWIDNVGHSLDGAESVAIKFAVDNLESWAQNQRKNNDETT